MYEFEVAHSINCFAAASFCVPAGTAKAQAHNQLERTPIPLSGASAKPTLSATVESFGFVTKDAATVASIHIPHFPCWKSERFSLNPLVA